MCLYPKLIKNPKYTSTAKNGGNIPPITDDRVTMVPVGCGNCIECRKQKSREWQVRLAEDIKEHTNAKFITLTFSNEKITEIRDNIYEEADKNKTMRPEGYLLDNEIATYATRHYLERWRKKYGKSQRHWFVTELGHNGTEHVHMHGIIWTDESLDEVEKIWQYGHVWKGRKMVDKNGQSYIQNYVNAKTVNYIVKYVSKIDTIHKDYRSKILTSAGIGRRYTEQKIGDWQKNKFNGERTNEAYRTQTGNKLSLPIYMRNKIYSEEEREKLWLQKLDKQERWVLGQKIDISKGEDEYNRALKYAQQTNRELGYGSDEKNWEESQYEHQRRILKQKERWRNKASK